MLSLRGVIHGTEDGGTSVQRPIYVAPNHPRDSHMESPAGASVNCVVSTGLVSARSGIVKLSVV